MAERPSGYWYVRLRDGDPLVIAQWFSGNWFLDSRLYKADAFTVLFGPIPGPEELAAMGKDLELLENLVCQALNSLQPFAMRGANGSCPLSEYDCQDATREYAEIDAAMQKYAAISQAAPEQEKTK